MIVALTLLASASVHAQNPATGQKAYYCDQGSAQGWQTTPCQPGKELGTGRVVNGIVQPDSPPPPTSAAAAAQPAPQETPLSKDEKKWWAREGQLAILKLLGLGIVTVVAAKLLGLKRIVILLLISAGAFYVYKSRERATDEALNPEIIANPVYAEIRMTSDGRARSFEQVLFAKTVSAADCKKLSDDTLLKLANREAATGAGFGWKLKSTECSSELPPRYAILFDNKPAMLTYLSLARGERHEREMRLLYWGISVEESDKVCDGVARLQAGRKGAATCIRAARL